MAIAYAELTAFRRNQPPPPIGTRDPAVWPFATNSPLNYPLGTGAVYVDPSSGVNAPGDAVNGQITTLSVVSPCRGAVYTASSTDPIRRYVMDCGIPCGLIATPPYTQQCSSFAMRQPNGMIFDCLDGHGAIITEDHFVIIDGNGVYLSGGNVHNNTGINFADLLGPGFGYEQGARVPANGFPVPNQDCNAPNVRPGTYEIAGSIGGIGIVQGGWLVRSFAQRIQHVIQVTTPCRYHQNAVVWPGISFDPACGPSAARFGNMKMGGLFAVPPSLLNWQNMRTVEGRNLCRAATEYGFIIADTGDSGGFEIQTDKDGFKTFPCLPYWNHVPSGCYWVNPYYTGTSSSAAWLLDLVDIKNATKLVQNSHFNGGAPRGYPNNPALGIKCDGGDGVLYTDPAPAFASAYSASPSFLDGNGRPLSRMTP